MVDPDVSAHLGRKVLMIGSFLGRELDNEFYMVRPKLLPGFIRLGCDLQVSNDREVARGSTPLLKKRVRVVRGAVAVDAIFVTTGAPIHGRLARPISLGYKGQS